MSDKSNHKTEHLEDSQFERLLKSAGDLREQPGNAQIEKAFRRALPVFTEVRTHKSRRTFIQLGLAFSLVVAVTLGLVLGRQESVPLEFVADRIIGNVVNAENGQSLQTGDRITQGMAITAAANSQAILKQSDGTALFVNSSTRLVLGNDRDVELHTGSIYLDTDTAKGEKQPFAISTSFGSVRHIGTRYLVSVSDVLNVQVRSGLVEIAVSGGEEYRIEQGRQASLSRDRSYFENDIGPVPGWQWVERVENYFEIEGVSYAEFVRWYEQRSGNEVRFSDSETRMYAENTPLSGDISNLEPEEAFLLLTEAVGLVHEQQNELITVSRPSSKRERSQ